MKVNYEILKNSTDQDGNPFTIIKMPVPEIDYMTFALDTSRKNDEIKFLSQQILSEQKSFSIGDTVHFVPSSSYLNFLITNKTVYEAKYWEEGKSEITKAKDEKAKQILQQYFFDRNIYQISTLETNHNGGGLHCWSMQMVVSIHLLKIRWPYCMSCSGIQLSGQLLAGMSAMDSVEIHTA